jgi:hypothetical protein
MRIRPANHKTARGFVIGELLLALLLLAVAVSSLAALMYSASRRPTAAGLDPQCAASAAAAGKCVPTVPEGGGPSKLLRSGCATRSVFDQRNCKDTVVGSSVRDSSAETVLKPRTDSAAMALLAKKQKAQRAVERPDRGFIR